MCKHVQEWDSLAVVDACCMGGLHALDGLCQQLAPCAQGQAALLLGLRPAASTWVSASGGCAATCQQQCIAATCIACRVPGTAGKAQRCRQ